MIARSTVLRSACCALVALLLSIQPASAAWSGWREVPGGGLTDVALNAAVFDDAIYLFGKGLADKKVYVARGNGSGSGWGGWSEVPGGGLTDAALASARLGSSLYLFG